LVELLDGEFAQVNFAFAYDGGHAYLLSFGLEAVEGEGGEAREGWDVGCSRGVEKWGSVATGKSFFLPSCTGRERERGEGRSGKW